MKVETSAYLIPLASECNDVETCRIVFDHSSCSYGQPAVLLTRGSVAGTPCGPGDARGGLIQHNGKHKHALESAGWIVVDDRTITDAVRDAGLLVDISEADAPPPIDPDGCPQDFLM